MKKGTILLLFILLVRFSFSQEDLLNILQSEADRNFAVLKNETVPAYYISYRVHDTETHTIQSSFGNTMTNTPSSQRLFNAMVRVGSPQLDNTRELKSDGITLSADNSIYGNLVMENDPLAIKKEMWSKTDQLYKDAVKKYESVKANVAVKVASEDQSDDFSVEEPAIYSEDRIDFRTITPDLSLWEKKLNNYTTIFAQNKDILTGNAYFTVELVRRYFVDTDGARITENAYCYRLQLQASATAEDGMDLPLYKSYFAYQPEDLPSDDTVLADVSYISEMLSKLKKAPVVESYSGPAIMTARSSGVFFHEIFGHRIEGARLKQESDAQTFKKKIGQLVLPKEFSVIFNPQIKKYKDLPLSGSYTYDDEGVRGEKVNVVENGILKSFLMSRTPIEGFSRSNGHGRGMIYYSTVTRQSNMLIESTNLKSMPELRKMLIAEAKKQKKEYAYIFDEVSGGFTMTGRYIPNSFNVTPLIVYKVYTDGRPDELVRGVDMVGTPLSMFSQIAASGDRYEVFNGMCGAESGYVPVSCVSPAIFVKMIETQKQSKSQEQPPILERP